jgi:hypothetical protein
LSRLWRRQRLETVAPATCRCADHPRTRANAREWAGPDLRNYRKNSGFLVEIAVPRRARRWTCGHPQKEAASSGCSDQDDLRFRFSPDKPASRSSYMGQRGAHPHRDQQITTFWSEISAKFRAPCSNPCVLDAEWGGFDANGGTNAGKCRSNWPSCTLQIDSMVKAFLLSKNSTLKCSKKPT